MKTELKKLLCFTIVLQGVINYYRDFQLNICYLTAFQDSLDSPLLWRSSELVHSKLWLLVPHGSCLFGHRVFYTYVMSVSCHEVIIFIICVCGSCVCLCLYTIILNLFGRCPVLLEFCILCIIVLMVCLVAG